MRSSDSNPRSISRIASRVASSGGSAPRAFSSRFSWPVVTGKGARRTCGVCKLLAGRLPPGSNCRSVALGFEWRPLTVPRADGAALAPGLARRRAHLCLGARLRDVVHAAALEGRDRRLRRAPSARLLGLLRIPPRFLRTLCSGILNGGRQLVGRGLLREGGWRLRGWLVGSRWLVLSGHSRAETW